ncbi:sporulation protein YjcZ, partial [Bacillus cereus]
MSDLKFPLLLKGEIFMGFGDSYGGGCGFAGGFALLIVLFILLIIVGASCF